MRAPDLLSAAARSVAELRMHGREAVRLRMHPLDAETIVADYDPAKSGKPLLMLMGLEVIEDDAARLGEPVAEFDATA